MVAFDLPAGYYALRFSAVIQNPKTPKIMLDNITVVDGNCTFDEYGKIVLSKDDLCVRNIFAALL